MSYATPSVKRQRAQSPDGAADDPELSSNSAVDRLPFDILSEIFIWTEAVFRDEQGSRVLTPWTPAYILCRVSKAWRAVAFDTPDLWTCMTIKGVRSERRGETWIEHAKGRPITAWVWAKTKSGFADEFLARHTNQVEDLSLTFPAWDWQKSSHPKASLTWPSAISGILSLVLQHVVLSFTQFTSIFRTAPRLEHLIALHDRHDAAVRHSFNISPSGDHNTPTRLTHLQLNTGFESVDELCNLLRLCPALKFLSVGPIAVPDIDGDESGNAVELPALIAASMPMLPVAHQSVPRLVTPAMQRMVFIPHDRSCDEEHDLSCETLEEGLQDGSLFVEDKALEIERLDIDIEDLLFFLGRMPYLEELTIGYSEQNLDPLIDFLTTPDENGVFQLRVLRSLTVEEDRYWAGSLKGFERRYEGIPSMICQIPPPLERVYLRNCWVCSGFNAARRLFDKHGTFFLLEHQIIRYEWDDDLKTPSESESGDDDLYGRDTDAPVQPDEDSDREPVTDSASTESVGSQE